MSWLFGRLLGGGQLQPAVAPTLPAAGAPPAAPLFDAPPDVVMEEAAHPRTATGAWRSSLTIIPSLAVHQTPRHSNAGAAGAADTAGLPARQHAAHQPAIAAGGVRLRRERQRLCAGLPLRPAPSGRHRRVPGAPAHHRAGVLRDGLRARSAQGAAAAGKLLQRRPRSGAGGHVHRHAPPRHLGHCGER